MSQHEEKAEVGLYRPVLVPGRGASPVPQPLNTRIPLSEKIPSVRSPPSSSQEHPAPAGWATETTRMGWGKPSWAGRQGHAGFRQHTPSSAFCPPPPPCSTWPAPALFHPERFLINSHGIAHRHGDAGSPGTILPWLAHCPWTPAHRPQMLAVGLSPPAPSTFSFPEFGSRRCQWELPPVITELI